MIDFIRQKTGASIRRVCQVFDLPRSSYHAAHKPTAPRLDEAWAGDITYIPTPKGWRYLAIVIDLYSRKVIGWSLADHMRAELVCQALEQALGSRSGYQGVIFHSDGGSQYGSQQFRDLLSRAKVRQSMSARTNP